MLRVVKEFCRNYKALTVIFLYMIGYLICFQYLEQRKGSYHVIHFGIDGYIPFCEYFIIPYILWFFYVSFSVIFFAMKDQEEGNKLVAFLIAGMTVFLIISAVFPNGHHLRPKIFTRDNIFIDMVKHLYSIDTSTNVVPSIHVYNSIAVMITVLRTKLLKQHAVIKWSMFGLGVSIICSTVFLKQHSMLDVLTAGILSALMYSICYRNEYQHNKEVAKAKI